MATSSPLCLHRPDSRAADASKYTAGGGASSRPKSALALFRNFLGHPGRFSNQGTVSASSGRPDAELLGPRGEPAARASLLRPMTPSKTLATDSPQDTRRSGRHSSLFRRSSRPNLAISPLFSSSSSSLPLTQTPPLVDQTHGTHGRQRRASFSHLARGRSLSRTSDGARVPMADEFEESGAPVAPPSTRRIYKSEDVEHYIRRGVPQPSDLRHPTTSETPQAVLASSDLDSSRISPEASSNNSRPHRRSNSLSSASLLSIDGLRIRRGIFERKNHSDNEEHDRVAAHTGSTAGRSRLPSPPSAITPGGHYGSDRTSSTQSISPLPRSSSKLRLMSTSSAVTVNVKSAGRKGWTAVRRRGLSSVTRADPSAMSPMSFVHGDLPNDATQRWLQLEHACVLEPSSGLGLIFGIPLASAVLQTRLVSPGIDPGYPLNVREKVDRSRRQNKSPCLDLPESSPTVLGTLDFGADFTFPSSFLMGRVDDSAGAQPDDTVVASADTTCRAPSPESPLPDSRPLDRQSARHHMLPRFVTRCLESLETFGLQEEGIYRLSGRSSHTARLRALFDGTCEPPWSREGSFAHDLDLKLVSPVDCDINSVCSILKAYLRELPQPLLTRLQLGRLEGSLSGAAIDLDEAQSCLQDSEPHEWYLLREIALHLSEVSSEEHIGKTRMTLSNICLVLAPTLSIPVHLLQLIVQRHDVLFSSAPGQRSKSRGSRLTRHSEDDRSPSLLFGEASIDTNRQSKASSTSTILPQREQAEPARVQELGSGQSPFPQAAPALTWLSQRRGDSEASDHQRQHSASTSTASLSFSYTSTASTQHSGSYFSNPELPEYGNSSGATSSLSTLASVPSETEDPDAHLLSAACAAYPLFALERDDVDRRFSPYCTRSRARSPTAASFTSSSCPALAAIGDKPAASSTLIPVPSFSSLRSSGPPSQYATPSSSPHISEAPSW